MPLPSRQPPESDSGQSGQSQSPGYRNRCILLISLFSALIAIAIVVGVRLRGTNQPSSNFTASKGGRNVILLGFDGADPKLCEKWMQERDPKSGKPYLENLAKLKEQGTFRKIETTFPAQTPVAWASIACSANPGATSIADFVGRDPQNMALYLTLVGEGERMTIGLPRNLRWVASGVAAFLMLPLCVLLMARSSRTSGPLLRSAAFIRGVCAGILSLASFFAIGLALNHWIPHTLRSAKNLRKGTPLWKVIGEGGLRSTLLRFPLTFPAENVPGMHMLAGLGVPDATGAPFSWTCFDPEEKVQRRTETLGHVLPWSLDETGWYGLVEGPRNPLSDQRTSVLVRYQDGLVRIGREEGQSIKRGEWSRPFETEIALSPLASLQVTVRACRLTDTEPPKLLVGPLQFHPRGLPPNVPISTPPDFARDLADVAGIYSTAGWDIATHPAKDGYLTEEGFLNDLYDAFDRDEAMFTHELNSGNWNLLCSVFMETDRAGHILWKHFSKEHPIHNPASAEKGREELRKVYQRMDQIVGKAMRRAQALNAALIVISDHGFAAFDYEVHLNTVLRNADLLKMREDSLPADATQVQSNANFSRIEFSQTQAYAIGLGGIYLNMKGRERYGVVREEERTLIIEIIEQALKKLKHPKTGTPIVRRIVRNEDLYKGPYANLLPDLLVCFEPGFRVSWATVVGGVPPLPITANHSHWSGDHCSIDPEAVPGIFFCSLPLDTQQDSANPDMHSIAPTILKLLGLESIRPAEWEGHVISFSP